MIFAMGFDKLIFGHLPNFLSIIGSSLILGAAIFVALQKKAPAIEKDIVEGSALLVDEEAGRTSDCNPADDPNESMLQEVQMRTLR